MQGMSDGVDDMSWQESLEIEKEVAILKQKLN